MRRGCAISRSECTEPAPGSGCVGTSPTPLTSPGPHAVTLPVALPGTPTHRHTCTYPRTTHITCTHTLPLTHTSTSRHTHTHLHTHTRARTRTAESPLVSEGCHTPRSLWPSTHSSCPLPTEPGDTGLCPTVHPAPLPLVGLPRGTGAHGAHSACLSGAETAPSAAARPHP